MLVVPTEYVHALDPCGVNYYGTFRDKVIRESAFRKTRTVFEVFRQLIEELRTRTSSSQSVPLWTLVGKRHVRQGVE
jgi:hypothetical protein